jgi:hypothetical protein
MYLDYFSLGACKIMWCNIEYLKSRKFMPLPEMRARSNGHCKATVAILSLTPLLHLHRNVFEVGVNIQLPYLFCVDVTI